MRLSFRQSLTIPVVSVIVLVMAATQVAVYFQASKTIRQEMFSNMRGRVDIAVKSLDTWIDNRELDVLHLAESAEVKDYLESGKKADLARIDARFAAFAKSHQRLYAVIYLADARGKAVAGSNASIVGKDLSERDYMKTVLATGKTTISDPVVSASTGKKVFVVAMPLLDARGKLLGMVGASVTLSAIEDVVVNGVMVGSTGHAFIVNKAGAIIAAPAKGQAKDIKASSYGKDLLSLKSGQGIYPEGKQEVALCYAPSPQTGWIVAMTVPATEMTTGLVSINHVSWAGGLLVCAAVIIILMTQAGRAARLVREMAAALRKVADGEVELELSPRHESRGDEFGEMARSFRAVLEARRRQVEFGEAMAEGDLSQELAVSHPGDRLGVTLRSMNQGLAELVSQIGSTLRQTGQRSLEMADTSQSLSQGATEQAAALEQISSSVSQIASQAGINAENAANANELSATAKTDAERGSEEMRRLVETMRDIAASGDKIKAIIKSIDDIAFQTNILSLNAAVEAARAGRHGKGFAVVAGEVRALAARSASAAAESAGILERSKDDASRGQEATQAATKTFDQILASVAKAATLFAEIAAASREQAQGVAQLNAGFAQVEMVTQQNTSNAERTASSAKQLADETQLAKQALQRFKLPSSSLGGGV